MNGVNKITTHGYRITTRGNKTTVRVFRRRFEWSQAEAARLDAAIAKNLKELGYGD